jgi:lysophospholipase L1-like esterase
MTQGSPKSTGKIGRMLRHLHLLLRPPKMPHPGRHFKVLTHSTKGARTENKQTMHSFFRALAFFFSRSNKPKLKEKTPGHFRLWLHAMKRNHSRDEVKTVSIIRQSFMIGPKVSMGKTKNSFRAALHYLKVLSAPPAKEEILQENPAFRRSWFKLSSGARHYLALIRSMFRTSAVVVSRHRFQILAAAVIIPVALEVFLQTTTLATWSLLALKQKTTSQRTNVALCIGDSYTTGKFVTYSLRPYSNYLQDILKNRKDGDWTVVSFASQYLSSDDVLQKMPELLQSYRPQIVYLMIGINDFLEGSNRNQAMTFPAAPIPERAHIPWLRLPELLKASRETNPLTAMLGIFTIPPAYLTKNKITTEGGKWPISLSELNQLIRLSTQPQMFPRNSKWYQSSEETLYKDNGTFVRHGRTGTYAIAGNLYQENWNGAQRAAIWEISGDELILQGPSISDMSVFRKSPEMRAYQVEINKTRGWDLLTSGALEEALFEFQQYPDVALSHAGLAQLNYKLGAHYEAFKQINWLKSQYKSVPGAAITRLLMQVYNLENPPDSTGDLASEAIAKYPHNPWFWQILATAGHLSGERDLAVRSMQQALDLTPPEMKTVKASFLRAKSEIVESYDPEIAAQSLIEAYLLDLDEYAFIESLRQKGYRYISIDIKKCLDRIACPPEKRARVNSLYREAMDEQAVRSLLTLESRLKGIVAIGKAYGAQMVLVTYPTPQQQVAEATQKVAEETGTGWLNLSDYFSLLLRKDDDEKIMRNGQFRQEAFRLIAQWIANDLNRRSMR